MADYAFLHGGAQGGWVWDETLAALERQTDGRFGRALALDVPGCGAKRGRGAPDLGPDEIAAELTAEIEAAGLREVVLVGHSQAGTVLPRLLARRPGLYRRAVYVSCLAPLAGQTVMSFRATMPGAETEAQFSTHASPEAQRAQLQAIFCNDMSPAETTAFMAKLGADAWPERMYAASDWIYDDPNGTPASYVVCLRDAVFPVRWQEIFAERFGASRLVRIDAGHQVMNTRPHALAEVLRLEAAA